MVISTPTIIKKSKKSCDCDDMCDSMGVFNAIISDYDDIANKPSINGVEVSGDKTSEDFGLYGTNNEPPYPVTSVNGQTGDVIIEAGGEAYVLPVANAETLGGVKPENKTDDMTIPVGVDNDGRLWVAQTGGQGGENVTAEQVYFNSDLTMTYQFGKYTPVDGSVVVPANGKNLQELFLDAYSEDKDPTTTQPSISITSSTAKAYEAGTNVVPKYSGTFNSGAYTYDSSTGVTVQKWAAKNNVTAEEVDKQSGEFASYQVVDGANYKITLTATYSDGEIPHTALGAEYPDGQIKAGSKSATSGAISAYRNSFYGTFTDASFVPTSDTIRDLAQKSNRTLSNGSTFAVNVPVGAMGVIIAYPATLRDLTSVKDVNGMSADITSVFLQKQTTVEVSGANGYMPKEYKVFRQDFAKPNDTANTYSVQI